HLLHFSGAEILCRYIEDTRCVDIEGDLDLRDPPGRRGEADKVELAKAHVIGCHGSLALEDMDRDLGLHIRRSGEYLALLGGDRGIPVDEGGPYPPEGLKAEG